MENSVRALHQAYDGRFLNLTENEHRRPGENQATLNHHRPRAINLDGLSSVVKRFSVAARNWTEHVNRTVDLSNPISVRIANDQVRTYAIYAMHFSQQIFLIYSLSNFVTDNAT